MKKWYTVGVNVFNGKVFSLRVFDDKKTALGGMEKEAEQMKSNLEGDAIDDQTLYSLETGNNTVALLSNGVRIMSWCVCQAAA